MRYSPFKFAIIKDQASAKGLGLEDKGTPLIGESALDFLTRIYGKGNLTLTSGMFNFLSRDNDATEEYTRDSLAKEDPLIFPKQVDLDDVLNQIKVEYNKLTLMAKDVGMVVGPDKYQTLDRAVLNDEKTLAVLLKTEGRKAVDIKVLAANMDSMSKFTIQRGKRHGWFLSDFSAAHATVTKTQQVILDVIFKAFDEIRKTSKYASLYTETIKDMYDPSDTNVGWPLYTSGEKARFETIAMFKGLCAKGMSYQDVVASAVSKVNDDVLRDYPFCAASNRRYGSAYKFFPHWSYNNETKMTEFQIGIPRVREVIMTSYVHNLMQSNISGVIKTLRKYVTGLWHDNDGRDRYIKSLKKSDIDTMEIDASAYDKNVSFEHRKTLHKKLSLFAENSDVTEQMLNNTMTYPYMIPDPNNVGEEKGAIIIQAEWGLLSGIKLTSDIGTLYMLWMICTLYYESKLMTETQIFEYLTNETRDTKFLIQGDDVLFIETRSNLVKLETILGKVAGSFSVKPTMVPSDRFLMKHMTNGALVPVAARILQQTLSNENVRKDPFLIGIGLIARMDRIHGENIFSGPPNLTSQEAEPYMKPSWMVLKLISDVLSVSLKASPETEGIILLNRILDIIKLSILNKSRIDTKGLAGIAAVIAKKIVEDDAKTSELMSVVAKDKYSASGKALLEMMTANPILMEAFMAKEKKAALIYKEAMSLLGINTVFSVK